ncbi:hypothetical protein [Paraburkholderia dipogonis]|uniref:hypothetical protein n=1 Tax=Paraburkholderia dipogonis TaxID=1211383 RepID=UPI0038B73510
MPKKLDFSELASVRGHLPLIVYELNEVPWRIVDWYVKQRPNSNLAKILPASLSYTTITHDQGELHPWSTWPTVHRGVYNGQHNIRFINQDLAHASEFPPIWEVLSKRGYRVGVFGSLQSYPVPQTGKYSFYVPDTFARTPETYPAEYSVFQKINLRQTESDAAIARDVKMDGRLVTDAMKLPFIGVRPVTFVKLATHLRNERKNEEYRARRPLMQAPLAFDVFLNAYKKTKPEFSTFFTNHVAGAMHRYWRYVFPEDFRQQNLSASDKFKSETVLAAMDIADEQIGRLAKITKQDGGSLLILSSMGQEAIQRPPYHGELRLNDAKKLAAAIGFHHPFKANLAMQPDFNFEFESSDHAREFIERTDRLRDHEGKSMWFRACQEGPSVNLGLGEPKSVLDSELIILLHEGQPNTEIRLSELGISKIFRDPGTGYHQPKGIMIWHGVKPSAGNSSRKVIESAWVKDMVLHAMSVA